MVGPAGDILGSGALIKLHITSNLSSAFSERRFPASITIGELKGKLEILTGANSSTMLIALNDDKNSPAIELNDDMATLGSYGASSGMKIHVTDTSQPEGALEALNKAEAISEAERFKLSQEEYTARGNTVYDFLTKHRLGKYSEEYLKKQEEDKVKAVEKAKNLKVGDRCEVTVAGMPVRRGTVMFVGEVHFKPGAWVGVKYDEPMGKNDGSVKGKRYFECPPNYGGFISPLDMEVGDYPEVFDEEMGLEEI